MLDVFKENWTLIAVAISVGTLLIFLWIRYRKWLWENIFGIAALNCLALQFPTIRIGLFDLINSVTVEDLLVKNDPLAWQVTVAAMALHFLTMNRDRLFESPAVGFVAGHSNDLDSLVARAEAIRRRRMVVRVCCVVILFAVLFTLSKQVAWFSLGVLAVLTIRHRKLARERLSSPTDSVKAFGDLGSAAQYLKIKEPIIRASHDVCVFGITLWKRNYTPDSLR